MKKIDKLLLKSFLGPFFLTFVVVVFILLMQHMLKYMDDILGKDLGAFVILELLGYFAVFMTPVALPLAVLLSSLMTYGNLGEHFELTAIKSSGISLLRTLRPLFIFVCFVTVFAFLSNNYFVPKAALKAYSLLYDIKQKKPSLDLKEGVFYDGIPGYSIKVEKKSEDGVGLKNLIIYNHAKRIGNSQIIIADSGRMETIMDSRYLTLELFDGKRYAEGESPRSIQRRNKGEPGEFLRSSFDRSKYIFSLESFDLNQTPEELFSGNKMMKDIDRLNVDIDSMRNSKVITKFSAYSIGESMNRFHMNGVWRMPDRVRIRKAYLDSLERIKLLTRDSADKRIDSVAESSTRRYQYTSPSTPMESMQQLQKVKEKQKNQAKQDSPVSKPKYGTDDMEEMQRRINSYQSKGFDSFNYARKIKSTKDKPAVPDFDRSDNEEKGFSENVEKAREIITTKANEKKAVKLALTQSRTVKTRMATQIRKLDELDKEIAGHIIKLYQKYSHAAACMIMFLIGAPLGAIIKRGGLGVPVLISIFFFIIFYVLVISGKNWGEEGAMDPIFSTWIADLVLLPFGIVFMIQAKNDSQLLDIDFYKVLFSRFRKKKKDQKEEK